MIIMFGKGKVGNGIKNLLDNLSIDNILMDDEDRNDKLLDKSKKIIITPGIKQSHKIYQKYGTKIQSELNFLGELIKQLSLDIDIIGITGTNGKSTTTWVLYYLFKGLKIPQTNIYLSGNFDTPLSETILKILKSKDKISKNIIILEASSFMLYKIKNFKFDYSILTNISTDHLDRHKSFKEYSDCKINILKNTKKIGFTNTEIYKGLSENLQKKVKTFNDNFDISKSNFLGKHNQSNLKSCYLLAKQYLQDNKMKQYINKIIPTINKISPLAHRLQLIKTINGIKIYDDGICTSSHALNAALSGFDKKVILIAGGYDKGDDYIRLSKELEKTVGFACLIGQTSSKLKSIFNKLNIENHKYKTLKSAINGAIEQANKKGIKIILFSPGSASFDMFKNVYDRVDKFNKLINKL
ncbi:UDP-N-acetylmuramoyl-L-alanine--D-glutamate ligase [Candidatus Gracilibacteria bacterium]|nr:UDP-N-acetylmuramoyl-L-alanine--D-glutamate ligase [Candidatus Gracilibacteria bacterium]